MSEGPGGLRGEEMIEAELKFPIDDPARIRDAIEQLGAEALGERRQSDIYLAHPRRDFAETDEALRIRTEEESARLTYKGPRLDTATKSRLETEITLAGGKEDAPRLEEVFARLGFAAVRTVIKRRELFSYAGDPGPIEITIDTVEGLGTFVELERAVPPAEFEQAKAEIQALARRLGLSEPEHRSYLGMLMAGASQTGMSGPPADS